MFKSLMSAAALTLLAGTASASTLAFDLTLSADTNVPTFTLTNTSTSAELTSFSFMIGDTAFNFDFVRNVMAPAGGLASVVIGDSRNGGSRTDEIEIAFQGFGAGASASFEVDIDRDSNNSVADYRDVFFNNGTAANSTGIATFDTGDTVRFGLPNGTQVGEHTFRISFDAIEGNVIVAPVSLPAGMPLMGAGLILLAGLHGRRKV